MIFLRSSVFGRETAVGLEIAGEPAQGRRWRLPLGLRFDALGAAQRCQRRWRAFEQVRRQVGEEL